MPRHAPELPAWALDAAPVALAARRVAARGWADYEKGHGEADPHFVEAVELWLTLEERREAALLSGEGG